MRCWHWIGLAAFLAAPLAGCGTSGNPSDSSVASESSGQQATATSNGSNDPSGRGIPTDTSTPEGAVTVFLHALRLGDDAGIMRMYSQKARQQAEQFDEHYAPMGSDTAKFSVGEVEYAEGERAGVQATWSDLDQWGKEQTVDFVWVVRRETAGWRIAGVAATPQSGEERVLLDFENLDDGLRQRDQLVSESESPSDVARPETEQTHLPEGPVFR